jgi:potassium-transporting ATPase potassium-binding subunit
VDLALFLLALVACLAVCWRFLGAYLVAVFEGRVRFLGWVERPIYRLLGTDEDAEQTWKAYAVSLVVFSGVTLLFTYAVLSLQGHLPLNPQHLGDVTPALAFNTSVSFLTNTNWQNYGGETTMSYLSQLFGLEFQQFLSAAVGLALAIAVIRGLANRGRPTIGNFWVDITRATIYVLVPGAFALGVVFVAQGGIDTLAGPVHVHNGLTGVSQWIALGPFAFMEAIKQWGTNGGGPLNANSAHPFENATGITNFLSVVALLAIPFSLTYVFGKMVGQLRQGVAVLVAMVILLGATLAVGVWAEAGPNPAVARGGVPVQVAGNMEGKEVRFGVPQSAAFMVSSTSTSTGSADMSYDSTNPMGGFAALVGMMLGEVSPGGVGSGLYTILLMAIIAVFIGGLMIGRTPEYLGKKVQAREVKLAGIGVLVMPVAVLVLTGLAVATHAGQAGPENAGPHGFTEILYAMTSQGNNNGSAFGGLTGNTPFYNVAGAIAMLLGRFGVAIPALALAGSLASKQVVPAGLGTFRTDNSMFVGLLLGVIVIIGGLTFFPALALGPIVEQLSHGRFWG